MGKVRYSVVIEWDPIEEVFTACVPALSVGTQGETRDEALAMVEEAILVTVEGLQTIGQPVPDGDGDKIEVLAVEV